MSETQPPKLLAQVRTACRARQFSERTAAAYCGWVRRFVLLQGKRHPREPGAAEVAAFLSHLANERDVSAATQQQAASALRFLYREVLELEPAVPHGVLRPRARRRVRVVFTREEAAAVLAELTGCAVIPDVQRLNGRAAYTYDVRLRWVACRVAKRIVQEMTV